MKKAVKEFIEIAKSCERNGDFDTYDKLCEQIYNILYELSTTCNAPRDWRELAEELAEEHQSEKIFDDIKLYEFI